MGTGTNSINYSNPVQHVFMVLAEYAFILRVIQMEKRKGDAARRQLRKSVKAVVAANQVGDQGSPAELFHQGSLWKCGDRIFPFSISFSLCSSPEGTIRLLRTASTGLASGAADRRHSNRHGKPREPSEISKSYLIFQ